MATATATASTSARRKQLTAQLEACFQEIQRLSLQFRDGIERLESATLSNLMVESAAEWFRMYLRLVDLGVEIRRGEQRHRSSRAIVFPCQHTTGTKREGARHTGLSIDDANALYQLLEDTRGVRDSQLEVYFMKMDALDRDGVGLLDEKLSACLSTFLRLPSVWYTRVETTGSDPHQELLLYTSRSSVTKITRVCFSASACLCLPDAQPWTQFQVFAAGDATVGGAGGAGAGGGGGGEATAIAPSASMYNGSSSSAAGGMADDVDVLASHALDAEEIGLAELKRQYGFDPSLSTHDDDDAGYETHTLAHKRRRLSSTTSTTTPSTAMALGRAPQPPREIYRRKCQERGLARKRKIEELLLVNKQGFLELNLSHFGFHAPQDLQDLLDVVVEAQVPVALLDVTNNFFDARSFELFSELLKLPLVRQHVRALSLRCMALPQRSDFAVLLRILTDTDAGAFEQLTSLDLSYNTFFEDAVLSLNDLLNGLRSLQRLSLESCFPKAPDPAVVEVAVVKDLVRTALVACCDRLQSLNFGSNWMSFPLLNSLLGPESALEELHLAQMTFFYFDSSSGNDAATAAMAAAATTTTLGATHPLSDVDAMSWQFSFQRQRSLTLSETRHSRCEYLPFCLDALTYCLKMRLATLQRLDLHVLAPVQRKTNDILGGWGTSATGDAMATASATMVPLEMQLDERMTDLLLAIAAYGALRSLRLKFDPEPSTGGTSTSTCNTSTLHAISTLFQNGLQHCESLELALNVPMSLLDLKELLAQLHAPCLTSLKLSVALLPLAANGGGDELRRVEFRRVFRAAVASLHELTLDFRVPLSQSKSLLPDALVQEMENVWRSIGLPPDADATATNDDDESTSTTATKKKQRSSTNTKSSLNPRTVSLVKRKPKKEKDGGPAAGDAVAPRDLMTFAFLFTDGKRASYKRC